MDLVTAFALMTKAIAEMVTEIVRGQSAEQKRQMWDWYVSDIASMRKFFKVDDDKDK